MTLEVAGLRSLGQGVAYAVESHELSALRAVLAKQLSVHLTAQDAQPFRPHVTVQNKVSATDAKKTFAELNEGFALFHSEGIGIDLWRYAGGPWQALRQFDFRASSNGSA